MVPRSWQRGGPITVANDRMAYYGRFYRSAMSPLLQRLNSYLRRWAGKKYRKLAGHKRFMRWWTGLIDRQPRLFAQWRWVRSFDLR